MRISRRKKVPSIRPKRAGLFEVAALFGLAVLIAAAIARAHTFGLPVPAPDNASLNVLEDTGDFVSLIATGPQTVDSSLIIASSTQARAVLGDVQNNASVTGIAGLPVQQSVPSLSTFGGATSTAAYGYAESTAVSYGAYGYGSGSGATGVYASTGSSGQAAKFFGPVKVTNDLLVEDEISAPTVSGTRAESDAYGVYLSNGLSATGQFDQGVRGFYQALDSVNSPVYGIYALSGTSYGVSVTNSSPIYATLYGIQGRSQHSSNFAGIFGWSLKGNGVVASVGAASTLAAAEGTVVGANRGVSDYSAAVFGIGGAYSGYFEGDVLIALNKLLYVGSKGLNEAGLQALLAWCRSGTGDPGRGGQAYCPD